MPLIYLLMKAASPKRAKLIKHRVASGLYIKNELARGDDNGMLTLLHTGAIATQIAAAS